MTERDFMTTVAQIVVNLNEGLPIQPQSPLHNDLRRTVDFRLYNAAPDLLAALETVNTIIKPMTRAVVIIPEGGELTNDAIRNYPCLGDVIDDAVAKAKGEKS